VAECVKQTASAVEALSKVMSAISEIAGLSTQIASATEQQTTTTEEMNKNLHQISTVAEETVIRAQATAAANGDIETYISEAVDAINQFRL
jgi:methyl-accepting chemotaxis protein